MFSQQSRNYLALVGIVLTVLAGGRCSAQEKDVQKRVKELLAELSLPDPPDRDMNGSIDAFEELEKIGAPAAPLLVNAASGPDPKLAVYAQRLLVGIGKLAVPALRTKWGDLNDEQRWRLVPVLEEHDRESVREYAWNCLDTKGPVRLDAWQFMIRTKEPRAKERYFKALEGDELPGVRWHLLPGEKVAFDEQRENALLIDLLKPDSWVAKGDGQVPPPGPAPPWWPDGRPHVIRTLHHRKVERAAPYLLRVLEEKGPGAGYLAGQIVPALADLGYKEAIPELERIAASKPGPGQRADLHPHTLGDYKAVRQLATDAIKRLNDAKP